MLKIFKFLYKIFPDGIIIIWRKSALASLHVKLLAFQFLYQHT